MLMFLAVMGKDGKGPSYSAGSGFIKRCKQISAGPSGAHTLTRIYAFAWQAMILIPSKSYALLLHRHAGQGLMVGPNQMLASR